MYVCWQYPQIIANALQGMWILISREQRNHFKSHPEALCTVKPNPNLRLVFSKLYRRWSPLRFLHFPSLSYVWPLVWDRAGRNPKQNLLAGLRLHLFDGGNFTSAFIFEHKGGLIFSRFLRPQLNKMLKVK